MKISIDLPSFAAGGALVGALAAGSAMPFLHPFAMPPGWPALAAAAAIAAAWGIAMGVALRRLRARPSRLRSASRMPDGLSWGVPTPGLREWLVLRSLDPSKINSAEGLADYEARLAHELGMQLRGCDAALADGLAALFRHLALKRRPSYDEVVAKAAATAWRDIAAGRRIDLSPLLRELGLDPAFGVGGRHAYPVTRLIEVLHSPGIPRFVPSDFLWLRAADETLWYAVNNCGRASFFVEGLGPVAHYLAERAAGRALGEPATRGAAQAVVRTLAASGDIVSIVKD